MLNKDEKKILERNAKDYHISMNAFVRMKIFSDINGILRRPPKKTVNNQKKTQHRIFMEDCNKELKSKLKSGPVLNPIPLKELEEIEERRQERLKKLKQEQTNYETGLKS